jgi:hypothetical protein
LPPQDEGLKESPPWRQEAQKTRRLATQYKKTLDDTFPMDGAGAAEEDDDGAEDQVPILPKE